MELPPTLALAQAVPILPDRPGYWFEPKWDGHRAAMVRTEDSVIIYARSGRIVTSHWMDLATAGMALLPGTVLDGEAVIWHGGRLDFSAVQSRAASSVRRARELAARLPASFVAWDILQHPTLGDVRSRTYVERRGLLLDLLAQIGPPIQVTPATDDRDTALLWYEALVEQGFEGLVCKFAGQGYPGGRRSWVKVRHAETQDAAVVGFTGPRARPRNLALVLTDDDRPRVSARLDTRLSAQLGTLLADATATGPAVAHGGERFTGLTTGVIVEVLAGTGRHGTLTVARVR
ncbi:ATP-dependent DNA ligase [Streptomyces sp. NPDC054771]